MSLRDAMSACRDVPVACAAVEPSRLSVSALASMVVAQLPFPPMPLCVVRGGDEAFCSSHDLLGSAVAVQMCSGAQDGAAATVAAKAAVLQRLQRDVFALVEREGDGDEAVARGYVRFQAGFREYMAFYPGSVDLRFRALGDVDPRSAVCTQAAAHLRAIARLEGCEVALDSDRYVDVLRAYLRLLHAYGRE
jgi:hypothetical protein